MTKIGSMAALNNLQDFHKYAKNMIPKNKKPTYLHIRSNFWLRFTVGGNIINHQVENYTPTADIIKYNLLLNIVIYAKGACFICIYLSNFYLITPFNNKIDHENVWIPEWGIPVDITVE